MIGQPFGRTDLIIPIEPIFSVSREIDIVRRVCIYEVPNFKRKPFEVAGEKYPAFECLYELGKISRVGNALVLAKRHVEFTVTVEATQAVVPGSI